MASVTTADDSAAVEACMLAYFPNTTLPHIHSLSCLLDSQAFYEILAEASTDVLCR